MTPDGWHKRRLGDVAEVAIGGTPSRAEPAYWDRAKAGSNRWVAISDLKTRRIDDTAEYITDLGVAKSNVKLVPPRTPIMSFKLTIGRTALTEVPLYTNEAIAAFLPREPFSPEYLQYALPSAALSVEADTAVKGQTLNKAKLQEIGLLLPPLTEQRKIAAILSSVDDGIEATQTVIDQLQVVKKAMMAELFTRGLPGRHTRFRQTEIGEVPEEWDVVPLDSLIAPGRPICYGVLKPGPHVPGGVPVVRITDYKGDRLDVAGVQRSSTSIVAPFMRSTLRTGDLLISIRGTAGRVCLVPEDIDGGNISRDSARISLRHIDLQSFVYCYLRSSVSQEFVLGEMRGLAVQGINIQDLRRLPVPIPPSSERQLICETLLAIDAMLFFHEEGAKELLRMKSALMSVLLTGEVRVSPNKAAA